jgi:hypothetical protein
MFSGVSSVTTRHAEVPGEYGSGVLIAEDDDGIGDEVRMLLMPVLADMGLFSSTTKVLGFLYQLLD